MELYKIWRVSLIVLTLVLASAGSGWADSLTGVVLDPDGRVVSNTNLRLFSRNSGELHQAVSAPDGTYRFVGIPAGEYLLEADASSSSLGASQDISIDGDESLDLTLALTAASIEVLVTASSTPLSPQEIAKTVDVIDSEEISLRGEYSLADTIRNVPGVSVQQLRGPGSTTTIKTRGLRSSDTAVLIDGMRFRDASTTQGDATSFLQDLTTGGAERVEFLRGSGSSLYGSSAVAGTVNIISRKGAGRPHGDVLVEGGGLGMYRGQASVSGGLDADRFTYSGTFSHLDVTDGIQDRSPYRNTSLQGTAQYNFTPEISLRGRLWFADSFVALSDGPRSISALRPNFPATGAVPGIALAEDQLELAAAGLPFDIGDATILPDRKDPDDTRDSTLLTTGITFEQQLSANSSYRIAYQGVDTERFFRFGAIAAALTPFSESVQNLTSNGRIDTLQVRTDNRIGDYNFVTAGYEFEREKFNSLNDSFSFPGTSELIQRSHAVFAQDQIRLLDGQLQLGISGRIQSFNLDTPTFSGTTNPYETVAFESPRNAYTGDGSLAYFFQSTETKLRAHVGSSYRAPSAYERVGTSFFDGFFSFWGDPGLNPERSIAVDGGIDQWLFNSALRLTGTVFYTNLQETIVFDFAGFPPDDKFGRFGGYRNLGGGIARGVELSSQISPTPNTNVQASYTYTNSDSNTPTIGTDFFKARRIPDHTFTLTATQWIGSRFNVAFDLFASGEYFDSLSGSGGRRIVFEGPVKADIVLRYRLPLASERNVDVYTKIENVFDNEFLQDGYMTPGAWAIAGLRFNY